MHRVTLNTYWGKLSRESSFTSWLSLIDHMIDVAATFEVLLENGYSRSLTLLQDQPLCDVGIGRLSIIVFLHDIGKAHTDFQLQAFPERYHEIKIRGHVLPACSLLDYRLNPAITDSFIRILELQKMMSWVNGDPSDEGFCRLLMASWGHHGNPPSFDLINLSRVSSRMKDIRWDGIKNFNIEVLFHDLNRAIKKHWGRAFEDAQPFQVTADFLNEFNGLVTLADWMASDTRFFPYEHVEDRYQFAKNAALDMLRTIGRMSTLKPFSFDKVFGFPPNSIQCALSEVSHV